MDTRDNPERNEDRSGGPDEGALLRDQIDDLEVEVEELRKRLVDVPRRLSEFEVELRDAKRELARAMASNKKLENVLTSSRERIEALREEVDKLSQPPASYGTVVGRNEDGSADIQASGRKMRVSIRPDLSDGLEVGQEVVLNESLSIIEARAPEQVGEVVTVKEVLPGGQRAVVVGRADEERVADLGDDLLRDGIRSGDAALLDPRSGLLLERLPRPEVEALVLEGGDLAALWVQPTDVTGVNLGTVQAEQPAGGDEGGDGEVLAGPIHRGADEEHVLRVERDLAPPSRTGAGRAVPEPTQARKGSFVAELSLVHHPGREFLGKRISNYAKQNQNRSRKPKRKFVQYIKKTNRCKSIFSVR